MTYLILYIEDSEEDFESFNRLLKNTGLDYNMEQSLNGKEALAYLAKSIKPDLIFLDLNLPATDGKDVLNQIKQSKTFKSIPVIIITTSDHEQDIHDCYYSGANGYLVKPVNIKKFSQYITNLKKYWFDTMLLPGQTDNRKAKDD